LAAAFGKLKSGFIERNKAKALAAYAKVQDLKSGKHDKYLYAISGWGLIIAALLAVVIACVAGSLIRIVDAVHPTERAFPSKLALLTTATLAMFLATGRLFNLLLTLGRLANFEDYRAELLRRRPDVDLPDAK
jgi:hypothetical protein